MTDSTVQFFNASLGRYEVQERLGSGGMARVYKGWDKNLERTVAVKILHEHLADDPTFKERFEREARIVAGFNHPNIVQVYDFDAVEYEGHHVYYMVMPYIPGPTLEQVLEDNSERGEWISTDRVQQIMLNIADALGYAHEQGMVHRDVKPGNILFDERGQAVLADFGIARLVETSKLTQEGTTLGTPAYMSPEQAAGGMVDVRTDIYAMGVILYEMLTGCPPFKDDGGLSVLLQHLQAPIPAVSESRQLDRPYLDAVVFRAMAKKRTDRYPTAQAFADDLKAAFAGQPVASPSTPHLSLDTSNRTITQTISRIQEVVLKPRSPIGILAVGLMVIAIIVFIGLFQRGGTSPVVVSTATPSDIGAESMTGEFYFASTFASDDPNNQYWPQVGDGEVSREITPDGFYHFQNDRSDRAVTSIVDSGYGYKDVSITMSTTLSEDSAPASGYGIVFRYVDEDNYSVFAVDGSGRYSIWVRQDGQWNELRDAGENWTLNSVIQPLGSANTLALDVVHDELTGYVNGEQVVSVHDSTVVEGRVGVYLATPRRGTASLLVDSYTVEAPSPEVESMTADTEDN